jgi:hypothetical protein
MQMNVRSIAMIASLIWGLTGAAGAALASADAEACHIVGTVHGASGFGKHKSWQRLAKHDALIKAEALNADHVVWGEPRSRGAFNGEITALAYKCNVR